jgi:hypothetical protein
MACRGLHDADHGLHAKQVLSSHDLHNPAALLRAINQQVKQSLGQLTPEEAGLADHPELNSDDGMDGAFCWFDSASRTLTYASAKTPLFVLHRARTKWTRWTATRRRGLCRHPAGLSLGQPSGAIAAGQPLYISTDGIIDQIGGPKRICFGKKRLKENILKHAGKPMQQQQNC